MSIREEAVEKIIERLSISLEKGAAEFTTETKFEDLNMKSANYSQLTTYLEEFFDVEVPFMNFRKMKTIEEAAGYIEELVEA